MKLRINITIIASGFLWLVACGAQFSGTYEDVSGITRYHFMGDGSALVSALGSTVTAEYTIDGNKVLLSSPQGTVVLTRKDGRLYGPMGLELLRQDKD
jgi:hypothetical protein